MLAINQGEKINITFIVKNVRGFLCTPDTIKVSIYPYGKDPTLPETVDGDAAIFEANPINTKFGQYTYTYESNNNDQVGTWYSLWTGTIGTKTFSSLIPFQINSNENEDFAESQDEGLPVLVGNQIYTIYVNGVTDNDLNSVTDSYWFTSAYSPMYSTYNEVLVKIGNIVTDLDEDTVNMLIYLNSLEADTKVFNQPATSAQQAWLTQTKKEYAMLKTSATLLDNLNLTANTPKSKQLGDLRVEWRDNTDALKSIIRKMFNTLEELSRILNSGGSLNAETSVASASTVMSENARRWPYPHRNISNRYLGGYHLNDITNARQSSYRNRFL